jgi:hypothetical protein
MDSILHLLRNEFPHFFEFFIHRVMDISANFL